MRSWMAGFLLAGVLIGPLGALLIAWQYHIHTDPEIIGLHFLALNAGYVLGAVTAQRVLARISIRSVALFACGTGFASLLWLSFLAPPVLALWRLIGLDFVGIAGGALVTALLYALEPYYQRALAGAANRCALLFGCGCLLATLMVGATYFARPMQMQTGLLALIPLVFFAVYALNRHSIALAPAIRIAQWDNAPNHGSVKDLRDAGAVLFGLLLFFQFGNEWAIAGWLPLFLIHRLGTNSEWAIFALAIYFLTLTIGRIVSQPLLRNVNHRRLLLASVVCAMLGYLVLSFTTLFGGALLGIVVIGAGFAPIYPLAAENFDERLSYHPSFYGSIFSLAIVGAMSAPWVLGYVDFWFGMQYVMLVPALGSVAVLILMLLIMLEARVMRG